MIASWGREFPVIGICKHCVCQKCPRGIPALDGNIDQISLDSPKTLKLSKLSSNKFDIRLIVQLNLNHTYLPLPFCFPSQLSCEFVAHGLQCQPGWLDVYSKDSLRQSGPCLQMKSNFNVWYSSLRNKKRLLYSFLTLRPTSSFFDILIIEWTSWNVYHLSELSLLSSVILLTSLY